MSALDTINTSCFLNVTPSRKRKRQLELEENADSCVEENTINPAAATSSCFTNAAFSSTPKKVPGKRRILKKIKEIDKILPNNDLILKSISRKDNEEISKISTNPYEVLRKPPKKKKRQTEEKACFENPALNLELPDKIFNPYEVVREVMSNKSSNCFSNPALNLKVQDASVLCNPFEVQRVSNGDLEKLHKESEEKPVLNPFAISKELDEELAPKPCQFKIGLPFTPKVGCRIAFNNISTSQLTPTKLLAEKLVFSPLPKVKVSLGSVGEEATIDIGKELDRYQLELENSINEAKLLKTMSSKEDDLLSPPIYNCHIPSINIPKKTKFAQKLYDITEIRECSPRNENEEHTQVCIQIKKIEEKMVQPEEDNNPFRCYNQYQRKEAAKVVEFDNLDEIHNLDELYGFSADDQEDKFEFKTPVHAFVRAYTRPDVVSSKLMVSKESLASNISHKSGEADELLKKSLNVKNIIRKSIRKLMHPRQNDQQEETQTEDASAGKADYIKNIGFMSAIRQSLRRKPLTNCKEEAASKENEISIIDSTERTMRLKSKVLETEFAKIEHLTNKKRHTLGSSVKKSTREVRNQVLKSVFNKRYEEYSCQK